MNRKFAPPEMEAPEDQSGARGAAEGDIAEDAVNTVPEAAGVRAPAVLTPIVSRVRRDIHAKRGSNGASCIRAPLTDAHLHAHLAGGRPVGVYPMLPGESVTRVAVLDMDSHQGETSWPAMCGAALRLIDDLEAKGMRPIAFRSTGGKGVHVYLLWDEPQDAYSVRQFLRSALGALGYKDGTGGVKAQEIEVFPKQDAIGSGSGGKQVGSMFVLPLAGASEPLDWLTGELLLMGKDYTTQLDWSASPPVPVVTKPPRVVPKVESGDVSTELVRAALAAIPDDVVSEMNYEEWFQHVCAIHHGTGGSDEGLALALEWSERSTRHDGGHQLEDKTWPYIRCDREGAITVDFLFRQAQRFDFTDHLLAEFEGDDGTNAALTQHPTQDNVALVFRRQFHGRLLFARIFGCWLEWDGTRWAREETDKAFDYARAIARRLNRAGKTSIASASFCSGVERFARADRAFAVRGYEFDQDNYLLNTPAGTFDLRTNTLRAHNPMDRITKATAVAPNPAGGERFLQFLDEITGGDASLVRFLQVSLGACLSGAIESHWMLFWTGAGRNGKNTLGDLVMYVIGDYGKKITASTLMAKSYEAHPTEIANLQGARIAVSSEVADGDHWNEARINELTGDETLSARYMRGDFFDFRRTHKHLIYGNHRPQLRTTTDALKARIKIVPFRQSFAGREDATLPARLREEAGYVLYWLLEGHAAWIDAGRKLPPCEAVERESQDYFASQSTVESWVAERIETVKDDGRAASQWPKSSELFADYQGWKRARGEAYVSQTRWGETMGKLFEKVAANGVRYRGAILKDNGCVQDFAPSL